MEFDKNSSISDEQRRLAEAKQVTVQPIHADIQPEDQPDSEIVAQHMQEPPIANIPSDTEQDTAPIKPSRGLINQPVAKKSVHTGIILVITLPLAALLIVGIFLWLK